MKSVLILGSKGFIGTNLINYIKKSKNNIKIFTDKKKRNLANSKNWKFDKNIDVLILLSGTSNLKKFNKNKNKSYLNNLNIILNAIKFCKENNTKLLFISSASVYKINNNYSISKFISEKIVEYYSKNYNLKYNIIRIFNVYGKNQSKDFLLPNLISQIRKKNKIQVYNPKLKRDYIYIDDVCSAIYASIFCKKLNTEIEIGNGISYSVLQVIKMISKIMKININKKIIQNNISIENEIKNSKANLKNAETYLNWKPQTNLLNGIKQIIK